MLQRPGRASSPRASASRRRRCCELERRRAPPGGGRAARAGRDGPQGVSDAAAAAPQRRLRRRSEIIGSRFSPAAHRLRDFATRNADPVHIGVDLETDERPTRCSASSTSPRPDTPSCWARDGKFARNPTLEQFAHCAGLTATPRGRPRLRSRRGGRRPRRTRGLGLRGLRRPRRAHRRRASRPAGRPARAPGSRTTSASRPGSRARSSPGTPCCRPSGSAPGSPCRATVQSLGIDGGDRIVTLADGTRLRTRCVLIASGVEYRRLDVPAVRGLRGRRASTTPPPTWRRGSAAAKRSSWSAAATRPARPSVHLARVRPAGPRAVPGRGPRHQHVPLSGGPGPGRWRT